MDNLSDMLKAMRPIGAYSRGIGEIVYKELQSYAEGFDGLSQLITDLLTECFVNSAHGEGLTSYETLVGAPRDDLPLSTRREMILQLLNISGNDFTPEGITRFFESLDFECDIIEMPEYFYLLILPRGREYSLTEQQFIRDRAESFLPCHLTFTIEFRTADWDTYDALDMTFDEWDALDKTWDKLDNYEGE